MTSSEVDTGHSFRQDMRERDPAKDMREMRSDKRSRVFQMGHERETDILYMTYYTRVRERSAQIRPAKSFGLALVRQPQGTQNSINLMLDQIQQTNFLKLIVVYGLKMILNKYKREISHPWRTFLSMHTLSHDTYPNITAFQNIILLSEGAPLTPAGGSTCNLKQTKNVTVGSDSSVGSNSSQLALRVHSWL